MQNWFPILLAPVAASLYGTHPAETDIGAASRQIEALRREVAYHEQLYFKEAAPEISDAEFDALKHSLVESELACPEAPSGVEDVPGGSGDDRTGRFREHSHAVPMLSLDKCHEPEDLVAFNTRLSDELGEGELDFWVEPKVDGMAVSVVYENGFLTRILSRGDGQTGEELTGNLAGLPSLPPQIVTSRGIPAKVEIRGEVYCPWDEFRRINAVRKSNSEPVYTSPRSLAAGLARAVNPPRYEVDGLLWVAFDWGAWAPVESRPATYTDFRTWAIAQGIPVLPQGRLVHGGEDMEEEVLSMIRERSRWPMPCDGVVVKLNSTDGRLRLGSSSSAPRWEVAYKPVPDHAATRLLSITWQVGRTGNVTPVAELAPVMIKNRRISRASLHHANYVRAGGYCPGDRVMVELAGDVIPVLTGVVEKQPAAETPPCEIPGICPDCREALAIAGDTGRLRCDNPRCPGRLRAQLLYFCQCHGITGLGEVTIGNLVGKGIIHFPPDLYELDEGILNEVGGLSDKESNEILADLLKSKSAPLARQIRALGIPGIGPVRAGQLARQFDGFAEFVRATAPALDADCRAWLEKLARIYDN